MINTLNMLHIASKMLNTIIIMMMMIIMIITITVTATIMLRRVKIKAVTSIFGQIRQLALALYIFYILYDIVVVKAQNQWIIG